MFRFFFSLSLFCLSNTLLFGQTKTIVFIHGLAENSQSWQAWLPLFQAQGYTCYAPDYPYHQGNPQELRNNINPALGKLNFSQVLQHYEAFLDSLQLEKPILIGHSMGGLIVQKLVEKQRASLGICLTSAPPAKVSTTKFSFLKANLAIVSPSKGNKVFLASPKWFHYSMANTLSRNESNELYQAFWVPESRNIPRSSRKKAGRINFKQAHAPLLFIAAEKDHITPAKLNRKNHRAYKDKNSICDFKSFENRSHLLAAEPNWEQVVSYVQTWIQEQQAKNSK